jgi:hypothetical protein
MKSVMIRKAVHNRRTMLVTMMKLMTRKGFLLPSKTTLLLPSNEVVKMTNIRLRSPNDFTGDSIEEKEDDVQKYAETNQP